MKAVRVIQGVVLVGALWAVTACTALPVISPAPGRYPCPYTVSMTDATNNATIHYSLALPVTASSPTYAGPFPLSIDATVYAMATAFLKQDSAVTSSTYTCGEHLYANMEFDIGTGPDGVRQDSQVQAQIVSSALAGKSEYFDLKTSGTPAWNASNTVVVSLVQPLAASTITGINIILVQHPGFGETADNWNLNSIRVSLYDQPQVNAKCILSRSGNPLATLTVSAPEFDESPSGC